VPLPSIVPTRRGTIQIEWHARGVDLEIDVRSPTDIVAIFEDLRTGDTWEKQVGTDRRDLVKVMRMMAARQ
jgi:hypothetical protein